MEPQENIEENSTEEKIEKKKKIKNPFNEARRKEDKERRLKKRARLIVRNISFKATPELIREHLEQYGKIEDFNLLKRADGKLVGCAFVQYETVNQAAKAILKATNKQFLGRPIYVDWAVGKDEYIQKRKITDGTCDEEPTEKKPKTEVKDEESDDEENNISLKTNENDGDSDVDDVKSENDDNDKSEHEEDENAEESEVEQEDDKSFVNSDLNESKEDIKMNTSLNKNIKNKIISNDVTEGCTVFIKNVPFDAEDMDLRKVCRKYGPLYYAIINRDKLSGHSKGTGFVKFKSKESADLCLAAKSEFTLMDEVLEPHPALSRNEISSLSDKSKTEKKDSRNLYLVREGLIMAGSKAAEGVSASDMSKRHKLEQMKSQVLKNLNRFVSRNRLSIHNLPLAYDNERLKKMVISQTGFNPHECRVMRERKITPEHPNGKSKGFGFMSFKTHEQAMIALRKLNNNPKTFGNTHRPIVAFSIEDRAVHNIKQKRTEKSKLANPTYQEKMEKLKEKKKKKNANKIQIPQPKTLQTEDKTKLQKQIKKLEETRATKANKKQKKNNQQKSVPAFDEFVGMAAKPGTTIRMRSTKKIKEQADVHKKRVAETKRKVKNLKERHMHMAEKREDVRPKQKRKIIKDDNFSLLVNKYKQIIDNQTTVGEIKSKKKPKRTKWYQE